MVEGQKRAAGLRQSWQIALSTALGALLALSAATAAEPGWKPEKAIEIIATNAPGGGSDRIIRIMTKILQRRELTVPISVVNKPGGGGSVSYAYLNQHPGDGHYVVLGPRGMTAPQVAYWEGALRRFGDSEEWKKELEANFWTHEFMGSTDTTKFLERENVQARAFLVELGLAK